MACATGIHDSIFNNFLSDTFSLSASARGWLELPREMPGFLVFLTAGVLAALPLTRMGMVGSLVFATGMLGLGLCGPHFWLMVVVMCTGSTGMHLLQPVGASVIIGLSDEKNRGARFGQVGIIETSGAVLGAGVIWLLFDKGAAHAPQYRNGFIAAAALGGAAAVFYTVLHIPHLREPRARMVFRMKYRLYYLLELLAGARKQVFITFGPWVLIKIYDQPADGMARLLLIGNLIGIGFKPLAGMAIDRFGERAIMIADGLLLTLVCIGYGYAFRLTGDMEHARILACGCYVADYLLFALSSARAVYLSRQADTPRELTSTLAMGVSFNHVVSMTIPIAAGIVWTGFGYERVFLAAAFLALLIAAISSFVPAKSSHAR